MNVLVVGGTGFVGSRLVRELHSRGHAVTALSRDPDPSALPEGVGTVAGDVTEYDSIEGAFEGRDAVVNLVALSPLFEPRGGNEMHERVHLGGTENVVRAAERHGVGRLVQMSALGADPDGETAYIRAKGAAERVVRDSALEWVIVRPSVVFGEGDEFVGFARKLTTPYVTGLPGGGRTRFQPIWVGDLAPMLADAATGDAHAGRTYELGGPEVLTLADVARLAHRAEGRSLAVLPVPMALARVGLTVAGAVPGFPMGPDQYRSLTFDNTVEDDDDVRSFGRDPADLRTLEAYLDSTTDGEEAEHGTGRLRTVLAGRSVLAAFAALLAMVGVMAVARTQVLQIPGYLVLLGFDLLQNAYLPGVESVVFWGLFVGYCYALAVVLAALYRGTHSLGPGPDLVRGVAVLATAGLTAVLVWTLGQPGYTPDRLAFVLVVLAVAWAGGVGALHGKALLALAGGAGLTLLGFWQAVLWVAMLPTSVALLAAGLAIRAVPKREVGATS